ncbi:ATP-binding protein [Actinomycetospora succinea]|uniref:ATP-binding protein n=1 Tax=Actinomycetospora succinea TaxID=663603 RepID=UPI003C7E7A7D
MWATAERLIGLRQALVQWVGGTPLSQDRQEDAVLAAYEAMANAVEHAYPGGGGGPLEVTVLCEDDELTVIVADQGRWKTPDPTETMRGRGRTMIDVLSDDSATLHREDGTTVTMRFGLGSS